MTTPAVEWEVNETDGDHVARTKFALAVDGVDFDDDELIDKLIDALPNVHWKRAQGEVQAVVFVDGSSRATSAARHLAEVLRAEVSPDVRIHVVQDLVSVSDIAQRTGFTRQYVRMLVTGDRGPGHFPRPLGAVGKTGVWHWTPVSKWLRTHFELGDSYELLDQDELYEIRRVLRVLDSSRRPDRDAITVATVDASPLVQFRKRPTARIDGRVEFQTAAEDHGTFDVGELAASDYRNLVLVPIAS